MRSVAFANGLGFETTP